MSVASGSGFCVRFGVCNVRLGDLCEFAGLVPGGARIHRQRATARLASNFSPLGLSRSFCLFGTVASYAPWPVPRVLRVILPVIGV